MNDRQERVKVWDWPLRLFHWTLVVAIAVLKASSYMIVSCFAAGLRNASPLAADAGND